MSGVYTREEMEQSESDGEEPAQQLSVVQRDVRADDPEAFSRHAKGQSPSALWIGCADSRVPVEMGEHAVAKIHEAQVSIYQDIGHSPFFEDSDRFNRELADFVRSCS